MKLACPLCGGETEFSGAIPQTLFDCSVCGRFKVTFELNADRDMQGQPRPYLSAATRKASESGRLLVLDMDNWQRIEEEQRSIRVSAKLAQLLQLIADRTEAPGHQWECLPRRDYPLIAARDAEELESYLMHLGHRGLVHLFHSERLGIPALPNKSICGLTVSGWQELEPLPRPGGIPGRCFVAMWFSDETREAYESGVEPAVSAAGFTPIRIDRKEHNNEIPDEIIAEIRNCEFMVADFTGQRAGVYYEAGFAMGLGRSVIWCCHKDEVEKLHFDTNHKNHIAWETPAGLRERLYRRIRATILAKG